MDLLLFYDFLHNRKKLTSSRRHHLKVNLKNLKNEYNFLEWTELTELTSAVNKSRKKDKIIYNNFLFVALTCKNHQPNRPNHLNTTIRRFTAKQFLTGRKKRNLNCYRKKCERFVVSMSAELDPADRSQLDRAGEKGNRSSQRGLHDRTLSLPGPERRPVSPNGENGVSVSAGNTLSRLQGG